MIKLLNILKNPVIFFHICFSLYRPKNQRVYGFLCFYCLCPYLSAGIINSSNMLSLVLFLKFQCKYSHQGFSLQHTEKFWCIIYLLYGIPHIVSRCFSIGFHEKPLHFVLKHHAIFFRECFQRVFLKFYTL